MTTLLEQIKNKRVVLCAGPGGVGKTTSSAALALAAARSGRKVCVLTIDPAKRLADALGVQLTNEPTEVDITPFTKEGLSFDGELHALMLDPEATLRALILDNAPDRAIADRVFNNVIFQQLSGAMAGTLEYTAVEKLHDLHANFDFDLIVVDTPPSKNVLDFLEAPEYVSRFLEENIFKWFTILDPERRAKSFGAGLLKRTGKLIWDVLGRTLGVDFVEQLGDFFRAMEFLAAEFRKRALSLGELLRSSQTAALVVATTDDFVVSEAAFLCREIKDRKIPFAGFIVNRTEVRPGIPDIGVAIEELKGAAGDHPAASGLTDKLLVMFNGRSERIAAEEKALGVLKESSSFHGHLTTLPLMLEEIHDLMSLHRLSIYMGAPR